MIDQKELENLAKLARIKIDETEKPALLKEFDSILTYIDQLKKVSVSMDTESRVGVVKNITRSDLAREVSAEDREGLLAEAPHRSGDFITVKKIIAQD